jgi:hypothetical protein
VAAPEFVVDFPTLWIVPDWIEQHCIVPDGFGFLNKDPFVMYDWQLWCTVNHYRVKPRARVGQLAPAFQNRRSQIVAPQKIGKGPWTATIVAAEGAGPVIFNGWAKGGELYECSDYGCGCGWEYAYEPGEPMGIPWPSPLIQITATSEDQTDNIYRPLSAMVKHGPLGEQMKPREGFIRLRNEGRIDVVTSSAQSRLGNPITFAVQDETGIWTDTNKMRKVAETQRRGLAGMGGRSMETTNAWDPSENSVAQTTNEARVKDVFKFHRLPPAALKFTVKAERRKILQYVYAGADHVDLDSIEAEAAELIEKDPGQAERFYGNRIMAGLGTWMEAAAWDARQSPNARRLSKGTQVVLGFDGSDVDDWTALRAETRDGYQFTPTVAGLPTIWNPAAYGGQVPRLEVAAAVDWVFTHFDVVRMYGDPPGWESELDAWAEKYGDKRVIRWETYRPVQMHSAAERLLTDVNKADSEFTHDGCETTRIHMRNARKAPRPNLRYVLAIASQQQKIDACVASIICHEAHGDVTKADLWKQPESYVYVM